MGFVSQHNTGVETGFFIAFAVISATCFAIAVWYAWKYPDIYTMKMTPVLCVLLAYENCVLAAGNHTPDQSVAASIAKVTSAALVPLFLVILFEMAYSVHKRRSVKFCGIFFDQGHRVNTEACSWFLRHFVRMFAVGLFVFGVLLNFLVVGNTKDSGTSGFVGLRNESGWTFLLFVFPLAAVGAISLYISIYMWKYGNDAALVVHATVWNRWAVLLGGSVSLILGLVAPQCCFRVTREAGMVICMLSILLMYPEIVREVQATDNFGEFLEQENLETGKQLRASAEKQQREAAAAAAAAAAAGPPAQRHRRVASHRRASSGASKPRGAAVADAASAGAEPQPAAAAAAATGDKERDKAAAAGSKMETAVLGDNANGGGEASSASGGGEAVGSADEDTVDRIRGVDAAAATASSIATAAPAAGIDAAEQGARDPQST